MTKLEAAVESLHKALLRAQQDATVPTTFLSAPVEACPECKGLALARVPKNGYTTLGCTCGWVGYER